MALVSGQSARPLAMIAAALVAAGMITAIWAMMRLGGDMDTEIEAFANANSDGLYWSLSQLEVEYYQMQAAAAQAQSRAPQDLANFTRRFDIFYSRVNTLNDGHGFQGIANDPNIAPQMARLRHFMDQTARRIDDGPAGVSEGIGEIARTIAPLAKDVRAISLQGLRDFTQQTKSQRERLHRSLVDLTERTGVILMILTGAFLGLCGLWIFASKAAQTAPMPPHPVADTAPATPAAPPSPPLAVTSPVLLGRSLRSPPAADRAPQEDALQAALTALRATRLTKKQTALIEALQQASEALQPYPPQAAALAGAQMGADHPIEPPAISHAAAERFAAKGDGLIDSLRTSLDRVDLHHHAVIAHRFAAAAAEIGPPLAPRALCDTLAEQELLAPHGDPEALADGLATIEALWAQTTQTIKAHAPKEALEGQSAPEGDAEHDAAETSGDQSDPDRHLG